MVRLKSHSEEVSDSTIFHDPPHDLHHKKQTNKKPRHFMLLLDCDSRDIKVRERDATKVHWNQIMFLLSSQAHSYLDFKKMEWK